MANKITDTQYYQSIANAIRSKNGLQNTYTPPQMAQAILDIPTGSTFKYIIPFATWVYGTSSGTSGTLGTKTCISFSNSFLTNLGVKKIRIRGTLSANAEYNGRSCTATLSERIFYNDDTSTTNLIKSLSSGTASSNPAYQTWDLDKTYDIVQDNIKELMLTLKSQSSYNGGSSAPIDRYEYSTFGTWAAGTVIDGVTYWGATAEIMFS